MEKKPQSFNIRFKGDLAAAIGLSIVLPFIEYLVPLAVLRIPLGLCAILLVPGYLLVMTLFPGQDDLSGPERIGVALGLSTVIVSFIGLGLSYTSVGITRDSFLLSLSGFDILTGLLACYRRSKLDAIDKFAICFQVHPFQWQGTSWLERISLVVSILSAVVLVGAVIGTVAASRTGEKFTEFYLLQPDGKLGEYPREIAVGQPVTVILGVINQEYSDVQYHIERGGNRGTEQIANLHLDHGETWEQLYIFTLTEVGENHQVTFLLYKGNNEEPYRSLHLWITVKEKPSAQ